MRRLPVMLAVVASLCVMATPALGADVTRYTISGTGIAGVYSTAQFDSLGNYLPGTYREIDYWASRGTWTADQDPNPYLTESRVIAYYWQFTVDGAGNVTTDWSIDGSAEASTLSVDRMLTSGQVKASVPANGCLTHDPLTMECTAYGLVGTIEVDLTATGAGRLMNDPSNATGSHGSGAPGIFRVTYGGAALMRAADLTGTVTFGGDPILVGGHWTLGQMSKGMGIEVDVFN